MNAPTHVIFDLDGTLLDTEPIYTLAAQAVVGRFGKSYDWSIKRHVVGGDPHTGARYVVEHLQLPLSPQEYIAEREIHMRALCAKAPAKPGAAQLVEALHARGIPLAVGTSGQRAITELKLSSHAFAACFQHIVCSDDPGISSGKPAPDIFLRAAQLMGAKPANCLVVEDTPKGVEAAINAGMCAIAMPDPEMRDADFSRAIRVIHSLEALTLASLGL